MGGETNSPRVYLSMWVCYRAVRAVCGGVGWGWGEKPTPQVCSSQCGCATELSGLDVASLKQSNTPLFSQHLLTVEQLDEISVDPDIQASVTEFLKGLTTQMFAR